MRPEVLGGSPFDWEMPDERYLIRASIDYETSRTRGPFVDGDTFVAKLHVPVLNLTLDDQWIRLIGVDTKELVGSAAERAAGLEAASYTRSWLVAAGGGNGQVKRPFAVDVWDRDNFGRVLLILWNRITGECLNHSLVKDGYSVEISPYAMIGREFWTAREPREIAPGASPML